MSDKPVIAKQSSSPDWFVQGILTRIGDLFDRLTGRGWKPSSSLATSELIERLKHLIDSEVKETADKRRFVPHDIKLKMQWDKFSTDSEVSLKTLETELLTAVVDHINDKRYYTHAPLRIEVKPDYFTEGVKLFVSFDDAGDNGREAEIGVPIAGATGPAAVDEIKVGSNVDRVVARFVVEGNEVETILTFEGSTRRSIGRTRENQLTIDDPSVSKMHASLMLNAEKQFVIADTGSTNGTFIDGKRISYGQASKIGADQKLTLGTVDLTLELVKDQSSAIVETGPPAAEGFAAADIVYAESKRQIFVSAPGPSRDIEPVVNDLGSPLVGSPNEVVLNSSGGRDLDLEESVPK